MLEQTELELLQKLTKDVKNGAKTLGKQEARYLVDLYYSLQDFRITTNNQIRAIKQSDVDEPHETLTFFAKNFETLENDIKKVLDVYTENDPVGRWAKSIMGIGAVLSAGLIANLDVKDKPTAGHFWSYCGLNDNNRTWIGKEKTKDIINNILGDKKNKDITYEDFVKCCIATKWKPENLIEATGKDNKKIFLSADGEKYNFKKEDIISQCAKRPYNAKMKCLCWKIRQSFVKVSNNPKDIYGKIYQKRKEYEMLKNENLEYKEQALECAKRVGKTTEAYKYYIEGKLPPAHIQARAERKAVQIFLSHLHKVMYMNEYGKEPPKPFAIDILKHAHEIPCPNV